MMASGQQIPKANRSPCLVGSVGSWDLLTRAFFTEPTDPSSQQILQFAFTASQQILRANRSSNSDLLLSQQIPEPKDPQKGGMMSLPVITLFCFKPDVVFYTPYRLADWKEI
jgi:hypothetical protein